MRKDTGEKKKEEIELMRQDRDGWCGGTGERRDERLGLAPRVIRDARCWVVLAAMPLLGNLTSTNSLRCHFDCCVALWSLAFVDGLLRVSPFAVAT